MASREQIYESLKPIFSEVFSRDDIEITPALTAADVEGWDSFKQIDLVLAVESHFAIKLTSREIDGLRSVGDLVAAIERQTSK